MRRISLKRTLSLYGINLVLLDRYLKHLIIRVSECYLNLFLKGLIVFS